MWEYEQPELKVWRDRQFKKSGHLRKAFPGWWAATQTGGALLHEILDRRTLRKLGSLVHMPAGLKLTR